MRRSILFHPVLSIVALSFMACEGPTPVSGPVVLTGELNTRLGEVLLVDCDQNTHAISGALRDTILTRYNDAAALTTGPRLWLTVQATDSSFSSGAVIDVLKRGPCLLELPGTYAMEPTQDGQMAAKVHIDVSGRFSLAVAPGDGTRKDDSGVWRREKNEVILNGQGHNYVLHIVHPDALVLEDTTMYGQVLRMTRR